MATVRQLISMLNRLPPDDELALRIHPYKRQPDAFGCIAVDASEADVAVIEHPTTLVVGAVKTYTRKQ